MQKLFLFHSPLHPRQHPNVPQLFVGKHYLHERGGVDALCFRPQLCAICAATHRKGAYFPVGIVYFPSHTLHFGQLQPHLVAARHGFYNVIVRCFRSFLRRTVVFVKPIVISFSYLLTTPCGGLNGAGAASPYIFFTISADRVQGVEPPLTELGISPLYHATKVKSVV